MGGTAILIPFMQVISAYFTGISNCVAHRGYTQNNMHLMHSNSTSSHYFDPYVICGASGPVRIVSSLSSLLSWVYLAIGIVMYTRRGELLDGLGGGVSYTYDEIGVSGSHGGNEGFAGDFPERGTARTMQV